VARVAVSGHEHGGIRQHNGSVATGRHAVDLERRQQPGAPRRDALVAGQPNAVSDCRARLCSQGDGKRGRMAGAAAAQDPRRAGGVQAHSGCRHIGIRPAAAGGRKAGPAPRQGAAKGGIHAARGCAGGAQEGSGGRVHCRGEQRASDGARHGDIAGRQVAKRRGHQLLHAANHGAVGNSGRAADGARVQHVLLLDAARKRVCAGAAVDAADAAVREGSGHCACAPGRPLVLRGHRHAVQVHHLLRCAARRQPRLPARAAGLPVRGEPRQVRDRARRVAVDTLLRQADPAPEERLRLRRLCHHVCRARGPRRAVPVCARELPVSAAPSDVRDRHEIAD
ncbi:hypothetical protein H4R19_007234, partial [Coemansia spiralis]